MKIVLRLLLPAALLSTAGLSAPTPAPAPAADDPAKNYTLFMGTDFSVPQDKDFYRVIDVTGGNFIIKVKDQEIRIPMRTGSGNLKVDQSLKLTPVAATIGKLKTERAYTEANDPYAKFNARAGAVQGSDAAFSVNYSAYSAASNRANAANTYMDSVRGKPGEADAQLDANDANRSAQIAQDAYADGAYNMSKQDFNNPGLQALELQTALAEENFDAMRYSFEVSSPTPLNRPYLVFIVRYHEKDARPGTKQGTVIYAKPIEPIGEKPAKINILQTGMPMGFIVEECQVRLYNGGQEVATNVAPRRLPMTKDEAFMYLKVDRIARAKGATLPASPALGRLNEETKSHLTLEQLKQVYYVKVSKEGRAEGVFTNAACTESASETVTAVVSELRFYPALEKSKEQAGVAKLQFSQIPI